MCQGFFWISTLPRYSFFSIFTKNDIIFSLLPIYFMSFIDCNCTQVGSLDGSCDDIGKCFCKAGFDGDKCQNYINWNIILIPVLIIILILVLLFLFGYKRYFFQLSIWLFSLTYISGMTSVVVFCRCGSTGSRFCMKN